MGRKSMAEALAETEDKQPAEQPTVDTVGQKKKLLELKRQALQSREVEEFIKQGGGGPAENSKPSVENQTREAVQFSQLNVKLPSVLFKRVKRAAFENKESGMRPATIQEVVMQALDNELKRLGY